MVELTFELTRRCNYDCAHCLRDFSGELTDISVDLVARVLAQARSYDIQKVGFTGGEPTLHPQFGDILDLMVEHKLEYHFVTNGTTFIKRVVPLIEAERRRELFQFVVFSLEGSCPEIHDPIREKGSFATVMRAIAVCKAKGLTFGLSVVISKKNRHDIDQIGLLASHLGADFVAFDHAHPTPDNSRLDIPLPLNEWRDVEQDVHRLSKALHLRISPCQTMHHPDPLHMCPTKTGAVLHVDYRGNLIFCCALSGYRADKARKEIIGDLDEMSLFEAHGKLLERVHTINRERLEMVVKKKLRGADYFPCLSCHRQFGQLDWTDTY